MWIYLLGVVPSFRNGNTACTDLRRRTAAASNINMYWCTLIVDQEVFEELLL